MPSSRSCRRHEDRLAIPLTVWVHGYEADGAVWEEAATVEDVCSGGVSFVLEREVAVGRVLRLELALPRTLRSFDTHAPAYRVYAVARHVALTPAGCRVGALFLGKDPPRGFEAHPAGRFVFRGELSEDEMPSLEEGGPLPITHDPAYDSGRRPVHPVGSRTDERLAILINLLIRQTDARGAVLREELAVSENLSMGGAEIRTSLELSPGEVIQVREVDGPFDGRAEVCGTSKGADGIRRLHVRFLDRRSPTHLIRKR